MVLPQQFAYPVKLCLERNALVLLLRPFTRFIILYASFLILKSEIATLVERLLNLWTIFKIGTFHNHNTPIACTNIIMNMAGVFNLIHRWCWQDSFKFASLINSFSTVEKKMADKQILKTWMSWNERGKNLGNLLVLKVFHCHLIGQVDKLDHFYGKMHFNLQPYFTFGYFVLRKPLKMSTLFYAKLYFCFYNLRKMLKTDPAELTFYKMVPLEEHLEGKWIYVY